MSYIISGRPDLGVFTISPSPPTDVSLVFVPASTVQQPVMETHTVNLGGFGLYSYTILETTPYVPFVPEPKEGIYKPNSYTDRYWPAVRARNFVKEINKDCGRMTYHNNLLYLANRCSMPIAELIKKHPSDIARRLGITKQRLTKITGIFY